MKKQFGIAMVALTAAMAFTFTACNDDSTSAKEPSKVSKAEDLSKDCEDGEEALVGDKEVLYTCKDGKWETEEAAKSSASKPKSSSSKVEVSDEDECDENSENCDEEEEVKSSSSKKKSDSASSGEGGSGSGGSGSGSGSGTDALDPTDPRVVYAFEVENNSLPHKGTTKIASKGTTAEGKGCLYEVKGAIGDLTLNSSKNALTAADFDAKYFTECNFTVSNYNLTDKASSITFELAEYCPDTEEENCIKFETEKRPTTTITTAPLLVTCTDDEYSIVVKADKMNALKYRNALTGEGLTMAKAFVVAFYDASDYYLIYCATESDYAAKVSTASSYSISDVKAVKGPYTKESSSSNPDGVQTTLSGAKCNLTTEKAIGLIKVIRDVGGYSLDAAKTYYDNNVKYGSDTKIYTWKESPFGSDDYSAWVAAFEGLGLTVNILNAKNETVYTTDESSFTCPSDS